jgi:hypothetical protein
LAIAISLLTACHSDTTPVLQIKWQGVFGAREGDKDTLYCLMGSGFFLAPTSIDIDLVIQRWLTAHPNARAIPVSTLDSRAIEFKAATRSRETKIPITR